MATAGPARDLHSNGFKRSAEDAPQHPAKKQKKTISVAGLFAKKTQLPQSTDDTVRKRLSVDDEVTAKAKRHPIYLDVKGLPSMAHQRRLLLTARNSGDSSL